MPSSDKELAEIKGYVARLYQMVRSRTHGLALELTEDQEKSTQGVGETIDEINTNLQIAHSFQQEEIYEKLKDVETLIKKLLTGAISGFKVEEEKFTKVEEWMAFGLATGHSGLGDVIAFVIEESEQSYRLKTPFKIEIWRGPRWVKRAFDPMLLAGDQETIVTIDKSKVVTYYKPSEILYNELMDSHAYNSNYDLVVDPWKQRNELHTSHKVESA